MPELPYLRAQRYISTFGLSVYSAEVITSSRELADYFEETVAHHDDARAVSNWIMGELLGYLNATGRELSECKVTPEEMAALLGMIKSGKVSQSIGKDVFTEMCGTGSKGRRYRGGKGTCADIRRVRTRDSGRQGYRCQSGPGGAVSRLRQAAGAWLFLSDRS